MPDMFDVAAAVELCAVADLRLISETLEVARRDLHQERVTPAVLAHWAVMLRDRITGAEPQPKPEPQPEPVQAFRPRLAGEPAPPGALESGEELTARLREITDRVQADRAAE